MRVAVIGTGNVGKALGGSFVQAGHQVTFAGRDAQKALELARSLGASAAATPAEAAVGADVIVLAVPGSSSDLVARELHGSAAGKVVIDVSNPLKPDYSGLANVGSDSGAEQYAHLLEGAHVAKAFNTLFAAVMADPAALGTTLDALFATDDPAAEAAVRELASSIGLRPVKVGGLSAARELEAAAWLNIRLQMAEKGDWRTSYVLVGAPTGSVEA